MKALVVGCGSIGRRHITNLNKIDKIEKIFVYTKIRGHKKLFDNRKGKIEIIRTLDNPQVDIALICNETYKHLKTACLLAAKGINLFIEKPVSDTLKRVSFLKKLARKKRIKLFVGYNLRFLGAINFLKKKLNEKAIGKLYFSQIESGQYLPQWRKNIDYRKCYSADRQRGGGVGLDLSHEIDYMRYLFGDPVSWKIYKAKVSDLEINSDDVFEGLYFYKNNFICNVHLDYLQIRKKRSIRIVGSKGEIVCDLVNKNIRIVKEASKTTIKKPGLFDLDKTYEDEIQDFISSVENDRKPSGSLEDGIWALNLIAKDKNV